MSLSRVEKERIAARARPLEARLGGDPPDDPDAGNEDPAEVMEEWRETVADGDPELFAERLERAGTSPADCRAAIADDRWPDDQPLPEWLHWLDDLLDDIEGAGLDTMDADVPFAEFISTVVGPVSERADCSPVEDRLSRRAKADLEGWLRDHLCRVLSHVLFVEFKKFLVEREPSLVDADDPERPDDPRRYYRTFVRDLVDGGFAVLCVEYPVMARLVAVVSGQWIDAVEEFASRLAADWSALARTFPLGDPGRVVSLTFHGDPHHGGRRVIRVTFDSGAELAYKPREIGMDTGFYEVVSWLNDASDLPELRTLDHLARDGYGWLEWVGFEGCSSSHEAARYYRRAGSLLCLLHVLGFIDGHLENVVADGDQPVVVDLETLLHPDLPFASSGRRIADAPTGSVVRTLLLPVHDSRFAGNVTGGFHESEVELTGVPRPTFSDVNTDLMEMEYDGTRTLRGDALPCVDGRPVRPDEHVEAVVAGFEATYRFLLDRREAFLGDDGLLATFEGERCRYIHRATQVYRKVRSPLATPSYLRSGTAFDCRVETLARPFLAVDGADSLWPIYEAERASLRRFDVPRFSVATTGTALQHDDRTVPDVFDRTPLERTRERLRDLDEADMREQLDYVRLAYAPTELVYPDAPPAPARGTDSVPEPGWETRVARQVFDRMVERAVRTESGEPTWFFRQNRDGGIHVDTLSPDLYDGRMGVAVFCAALASCLDDAEYREFAVRLVDGYAETMDSVDAISDPRLGGGHGAGGLIYGFATLGELLDEDRFLAVARRLAGSLSSDAIRADGEFDVLNGSAGLLLSLLALHERSPDRELLDAAVTVGEHLLSARTTTSTGTPVWETTRNEQVLAGFSHGVSGIAYALVRLADATDEPRFRDAARESIGFEDARFDPERCNWPDRRDGSRNRFEPGWCAGRAGVGLARLRMFAAVGTGEFRRDVERALDGADPDLLLDRDHLCCGNFGRVEFLHSAGRVLDRRSHVDRARLLAYAAVRRAARRDRFTVPLGTEHWYNPCLFVGESGVGYALMRLANPDLPCVLTWE